MKKMKNLQNDNYEISDKVQSIGINLTLISTLINFLECGISDNYDLTNMDIENLVSVMKKMIKVTIKDYDELECCFNI